MKLLNAKAANKIMKVSVKRGQKMSGKMLRGQTKEKHEGSPYRQDKEMPNRLI